MGQRATLHQTLIDLLAESRPDLLNVDERVYFQPPETVKLNYPCIIYELSKVENIYADDLSYIMYKQYQVTVIDKNPDSTIPDTLAKNMRMCQLNRAYTVDNLNHTVFTVYH